MEHRIEILYNEINVPYNLITLNCGLITEVIYQYNTLRVLEIK